jgi:hypothetical protein
VYSNWGKPQAEPVQPGPALANRDRDRNSGTAIPGPPPLGPWQGDPQDSEPPSGPYGVFVGGGYNEVIVGQLPVILETPSSSLVGWGTDAKKVKDTGAKFTMVLGPFQTMEEARRAYEENKIPGSERIKPFASGTSARFKFDGAEHDIDNALRLLR